MRANRTNERANRFNGFGIVQFMSVLLASPLDLRMYHNSHMEQEGSEGADI